MVRAATAIAAPASARVFVGVGAPIGYNTAPVCDPYSRYYSPYYCSTGPAYVGGLGFGGGWRDGWHGRALHGRGFHGGSFHGGRNSSFESLPARADAANRRRSGRAGHRKLAQNISFRVRDDDRHGFA